MTPEEALKHAKERVGDGNWHGQALAHDCEAQHFWPDDEEAYEALIAEIQRLRVALDACIENHEHLRDLEAVKAVLGPTATDDANVQDMRDEYNRRGHGQG